MRVLTALIIIFTISLTAFPQTPAPIATPFGPQPAPAAGQQQPAIPPGPPAYYADSPTKVFAIRYVDARAIERLILTFGVPYSRESSLNAITVKAPEKTLTAIEEIIKRFDVPANVPKKVGITAYLLLATPQAEPDSTPANLKPAIDQLRSVMAYKSYHVLDTILATGQEGTNSQQSGIVPKLNDSEPGGSPEYTFSGITRVTGEGAERTNHC